MRIHQKSKLLKIKKSKILSNLFSDYEKYGLKLGEFNNTTGTQRVNIVYDGAINNNKVYRAVLVT